MKRNRVIAGILATVTVITSVAGLALTANAAEIKGKTTTRKKIERNIDILRKKADKAHRDIEKKYHGTKVIGELSASNDLRGGKNTDMTFYFHPRAVSGSAVELQDPKKTYSLYEENPDLKFLSKHVRKIVFKHFPKYRKIATLKYFDNGLHVKGAYIYKATVTLNRPWIPVAEKDWYDYVVIDDKNKDLKSNVVKLAAIQESDKCDCDNCCCRDCDCDNGHSRVRPGLKDKTVILKGDTVR